MQTPFTPMDTSGAAAEGSPTREEIAAAAYRLHLEQGSKHGHDLDDWLRAEEMLLQQRNRQNEATRPTRQEGAGASASAVSAPPLQEPVRERVKSTPASQDRDHPYARDERGSPDREDIRRKTSAFRPASRQTQSSR